MTVHAAPGQPGSAMTYASRYDNYIGGEYVPPSSGQYFENITPVTGQVVLTRWHVGTRRTSSSPWKRRTPPPRPGATPARPSGRTSC